MDITAAFQDFVTFLLFLLPLGLWAAWCLFCVNWKKTWPVLSQGAWTGVVLLIVIAASAWAAMEPRAFPLSQEWVIPNFWWQLLCVAAIAMFGLFCGWLQGVWGWTPMEIAIEPTREPQAGHVNAAHHGYDHSAEMSHGPGSGH
ncbi:MAG: hypothetical protein ACJ8FY_22195 [Gemmataceae bacterium]